MQGADSLMRQRRIFKLINHEMGEGNKEAEFERLMDFANTVVKDSVCLNFCDSLWFAEVCCNVLFKGKKEKLTLFLRTEKVKDYVYRWAICGAKGALLELPVDTARQFMISPVEKELSFMCLSSVTDRNHAPFIASYKAKNVSIHPLSVFLVMVRNGDLRVVNAEKVKFHFLQVPGYVFTIACFNRMSMNAGWLIDSVFKVKEEDKSEYMNFLFSM